MGSNTKEIRHTHLSPASLAMGADLYPNLSPADAAIIDSFRVTKQDHRLEFGLPPFPFRTNNVTRNTLCWTPQGLPAGKSVVIASSRLNQKLDEQPDWFDALRTLAVQLTTQNAFLLTAEGTTTDPFVKRMGTLFQIPVVTLKRIPNTISRDWIDDHSQPARPGGRSIDFDLFWKPLDTRAPKDVHFNPTSMKTSLNKTCFIRSSDDELLISGAHSLFLLSIRKNGNVFKGTQARLNSDPKNTRLLVNKSLTSKRVERTLVDNGATPWWIYEPNNPRPTDKSKQAKQALRPSPHSNLNFRTLSLDEIKPENYLIHWTRRRVGPWPDQTRDEYLDDLIFQLPSRNHNQVSAICRILASKRILSSRQLTRSRRPVVCFSEIPLDEISQKRTFRPHLSRWDCEPYGLAVDRDLLRKLGACPVKYGTNVDWKALGDRQRPFFQLCSSEPQRVDWESEKEWRILGDLPLDAIPPERALVFVRTAAEAELISNLSRWPILILEPDTPSIGGD